jgi:hypothetical protein
VILIVERLTASYDEQVIGEQVAELLYLVI